MNVIVHRSFTKKGHKSWQSFRSTSTTRFPPTLLSSPCALTCRKSETQTVSHNPEGIIETVQFLKEFPYTLAFNMAQKRKASETEPTEEQQPASKVTTIQPAATEKSASTEDIAEPSAPAISTSVSSTDPSSSAAEARAARFAALKSRAASSAASNLAAARQEASRQSVDTSQLAAISRRHAIASHNLLKAESESNEAFERKRAWDWTVEESEKWDKRMAKKEKHREDVGFRNYGDESSKIYRRQIREMNKQEAKRSQNNPGTGNGQTGAVSAAESDQPDRLTAYEQNKIQTLLQAAQSGGLEIVESPDGTGELVLLDRHGTYTHPSASTSFGDHMSSSSSTPSRENVDRLVNDLRKAEETRLKKRKDRGRANDEADMAGDVTFINDKNKVFNQKLRRFYDKYTRDIRESFDRGTAI